MLVEVTLNDRDVSIDVSVEDVTSIFALLPFKKAFGDAVREAEEDDNSEHGEFRANQFCEGSQYVWKEEADYVVHRIVSLV